MCRRTRAKDVKENMACGWNKLFWMPREKHTKLSQLSLGSLISERDPHRRTMVPHSGCFLKFLLASVRQKISQERIVHSKWCILSADQQSLFHCVKHQKNEGVTVREILCSLSQNAPQWTRMKVSAPGKSWGRETMRNKGKKEWSCGSHRETLMGEICYAI